MLILDRRPCLLGLKSSTDGKEIDGQEVKLLTLELRELKLDKRELNVLLGEPAAWNVLYNTGVKPPEPYLKSVKSLELAEPIEGAMVTMNFGFPVLEVALVQVKLSKVKLELQSGGQTHLSCKVTAAPTLDETFGQLVDHLGDGIEVAMRFEPGGAQQDLPLNRFTAESPPAEPDDGEDDEAAETAKKPKRKAPPKRPPPKRKSTNGHVSR